MKFPYGILSILTVVLLAVSCSMQPGEHAGGGDDFPNVLADAGTAISENMNETWEHPDVPEENPLEALDNAVLPVESLSPSSLAKKLGKTSSDTCNQLNISIDEENGTILIMHKQCNATFTHYDTLVLVVNGADTAVKMLSSAKVYSNGLLERESYTCVDRDGDSLLVANNPSKQQQIEVVSRQVTTGDLSREFRFGIDAGITNDFSLEDDNRIIDMYALTLHLSDTVSLTVLHDADGDGFVAIPWSSADSAIVDVVQKMDILGASKLALSTSLNARMVVFPDEDKNYCIRYSTGKRFVGYDLNWSTSSKSGDSTFYAGDTVVIMRTIIPTSTDSIQGDTLSFTVLTGDDPADSTDDALLGISVHKKLRKGEGREVKFTFTADEPISAGSTDVIGSVYYFTRFANDFTIEVNGSIGKEKIVAEAVTSEGKTWSVTWDRAGNVLSWSIVE